MRRVSVIGNVGSGKSSVARALASRLGVPYVELDSLHWGPDWTAASAEELAERVRPIVQTPAWIVDGMYWKKIGGLVLEHADTVVWLDLPFMQRFLRVVRRTVMRSLRGTALWNGNRETLRQAFLSRQSILLFALRTARERRGFEEWLARPEFRHLSIERFHDLGAALRWAETGQPGALKR